MERGEVMEEVEQRVTRHPHPLFPAAARS